MLTALKRSHVLDTLDFRIGAKYEDVFKWIKVARPYYDRESMDSLQAFREQTNLVVGVVMTLTNNGKLRMHPSMLPYVVWCLRMSLKFSCFNYVTFTNSNTNRYEHDFLSKNKTFEVLDEQRERLWYGR